MKRIKYIVAFILLLYHCHNVFANGIVNVYADDVTIPKVSDRAIIIDIPISMQSTINMTSFQCDLYLPQNITFATTALGEMATESHKLEWNYKEEFTRIMCYSPKKETFNGNDGEIAVISVCANKSIPQGVYTVRLKNIYFSDAGKPSIGYAVDDLDVLIHVEKKILVESVALKDVNVRPGESIGINATILPSNADNKTLQWSSSNVDVATVNSNGIVTGVAEGTAVITAKTTDYSNLSATCTVEVNDYITFSDATVESLCLKNWDKNKDGQLSLSEAKAVTDIYTIFEGNATITSFDEFRYFTGVKTLKADAFNYCSNLQSIILPGSLTSIGNYAFYGCTSLASIVIPASVTTIGESILSGCSDMERIVVEEGNSVFDSREDCNALIKTSTNYLIGGCKNTVIPNSIVTIGKYAFSESVALQSIQIPNSVKTIEVGAFSGCTGVVDILIPSSVTSIGTGAFADCNVALETIVVEEGNMVFDSRNECNALFNSSTNALILGCKNTIIPNTCKIISASAFANCIGLISVDIPESVENINAAAFLNCKNLNFIVLPESVTTIGINAFKGCSSLCSISVPNNITSINANTFDGCSSLSSVIIGTSVNSINKTAFLNCNILSLEINSQSLVGATYNSTSNLSTFFGDKITNLSLGNKITSIGNYAFYNFKELETIELPQSLSSIGKSSFKGCSSLYSVVLSESLNSIGSEAFYKCPSLNLIYSPRETPFQLANDVFDSYSRTLYIPYGCLSNYKKTSYWNKFTQIIAGDDEEDHGLWDNIEWVYDKNEQKLTLKGEGSLPTFLSNTSCSWYYYSDHIITIKVGEGITNIGNVLGSVSMTHIELPKTISKISSEAFRNNGTLHTINIPEGLTTIESSAFYGCSSLESIHIPNSVNSIGSWAFGFCENLQSVILSESIKTIDNNTFAYCPMKSIIIPNSVTAINDEAFYRCENLQTVTLSSSLSTIGNSAFAYCPNLNRIDIPSNVNSVGTSAFRSCSALSYVSWGETLKNIGNNAFSNCTSLIQVVSDREYPVNISQYSDVFSGCSGMTLFVPYGCKDNYMYSSYYNIFEKIVEIEPDNYLFIPDTEAGGRKVILPIIMKNVETIKGLQFNLRLPDGVEVSKGKDDEYLFNLTSRASKSHTVASSILKSGDYRIVVSSLQGATFVGSNGVVMNVTLQLDNDISDGEYDIYISSVILNTVDNVSIEPRGNVSKLLVSKSTKGDVNSDGNINVTDVGMVIDYILEKTPNGFIESAADVNGDGIVNVTDVGLIIDIILSDGGAAKRHYTKDQIIMIEPQ